MREINNNVTEMQANVRALTGLHVKIKVNRGRNKTEIVEGILENAYPNIFTIRRQSGEINSFSYADIISKNVKFIK